MLDPPWAVISAVDIVTESEGSAALLELQFRTLPAPAVKRLALALGVDGRDGIPRQEQTRECPYESNTQCNLATTVKKMVGYNIKCRGCRKRTCIL
jgi:hypothetical protein